MSEQISIRVSEVSIIANIMAGLRASMPERFGDARVRSAEDLASGPGGMPPSDVLRFELEDDARVIVRPSGTEPKLKAYVDVRGSSADDAATRLRALSSAVRAVLAEHS